MSTSILTAAIDFGTTYSAYGFSFTNKHEKIIMNKDWGANLGYQSYKTPTSLLVNDGGTFEAFGHEAEDIYGQAIASEDAENEGESRDASKLHLFKQFKMELHGREKLDKNVKLNATDGYEMSALDVFALSLEFLKDHLLTAVGKSLATQVEAKHVKWILTVPAIWTEVAKTFMKQAAHQAGLIDDTTSESLLIALEPEAASLFCRTKDIAEFTSADNGEFQSRKPTVGDTYMVIDAGGGTMDITVHKIESETSVTELFRASGGPWGGIYVDKQLEILYDQVFGEEFMREFRKMRPNIWMTMLLDWEKKKKAVSETSTRPVALAISAELNYFFKKYSTKSLKDTVEGKKELGVKFSNGLLMISQSKVREMFENVLRPTMEHLQNLISDPKLAKMKCIFLVGGFGESPLLQHRIKAEFENENRIVLIPIDAGLCVIKGAVLFGHNPTYITSRIARRTFCFATTCGYDPNKHDPKLRLSYNTKRIRYLQTLAKMNTHLPQDGEASILVQATDPKQVSVKFVIYTAEKEEVFDPSDPEVHKLGEIVIAIEKAVKPEDRQIRLFLKFGGTSVTAIAEHTKSKARETAVLSLLDDTTE